MTRTEQTVRITKSRLFVGARECVVKDVNRGAQPVP